jgi:hypothetical protein
VSATAGNAGFNGTRKKIFDIFPKWAALILIDWRVSGKITLSPFREFQKFLPKEHV